MRTDLFSIVHKGLVFDKSKNISFLLLLLLKKIFTFLEFSCEFSVPYDHQYEKTIHVMNHSMTYSQYFIFEMLVFLTYEA